MIASRSFPFDANFGATYEYANGRTWKYYRPAPQLWSASCPVRLKPLARTLPLTCPTAATRCVLQPLARARRSASTAVPQVAYLSQADSALMSPLTS